MTGTRVRAGAPFTDHVPERKGGYTKGKAEGCGVPGRYTRRSGTVAVVCRPFNPLQHGVWGVEWGGDAVYSECPPPPPAKQKETIQNGHGPDTPPPGGGSGGVLPCCTRHAPSTATKARGAIWAVMWRTDPWEKGQCKEVLVGKGDECHCQYLSQADPSQELKESKSCTLLGGSAGLRPEGTAKPAIGILDQRRSQNRARSIRCCPAQKTAPLCPRI